MIFGERPTRYARTKINNGTASLVRLDCGPVAVTCNHVLEEYRKRETAGEQLLFQIGGCLIDPSSQCISASREADLAVLALTREQSERIVQDGWIGSEFFVPVAWPPDLVAAGEDVVFGGSPGQWREAQDHESLEFASYSQGTCVSDVGINSFMCVCRREFWVKASGLRDVDSLTDYGGLSGGPAFVWRNLHWDFAGVVREHLPNTDAIRIAHARLIASDGTIIE